MRIRLYHARILTMVKEETFVGEVWIKDDKIERVVRENDILNLSNEVFDEQIDCMGNLLLPGFKNCHAHGPMTFLRSYADDYPLQEWLDKKILPAEKNLCEEDIYILMQLAVLEYIKSGITTSFEMYFYPEMIAKVCMDMGFRVVISGTVLGDKNHVKEAIYTLEHDYKKLHKLDPLVDYKFGFHAEYSCSRELLEAISDLLPKYQEPVFMHNSETKKEVEDCIKRYDMTPVQFMNKIGLFDFGGAGHHLVYSTEEDRDILKEKGIYVVTNPSSNLKLASGIAPIKEYLDKEIPVAIGTDGPASNNNLNFFKEMYLTTTLQKIKYQDATAVHPFDVLKMATVNGANMLGLTNCNEIAVGKYADLILVDLLKPNMQPMNHIINNLIYSGSIDNVIMTMIAGKILYANGKYCIDIDPIEVYEKANYIIRRIDLLNL